MYQTYTIGEKVRQFMLILLPILVTQVALCGISVVDTTMSGHFSADDLAGVAIGSNLWMPVFTGLNGVLIGIVPIIAQLIGAKRESNVAYKVMQGIYLATIIGIIVLICGVAFIMPFLNTLAITMAVKNVAVGYLQGIAVGIIPFFICTVLRSFIDTLGYTRITMYITLAALPINIILNYLLVYGKMGLPAFGGVGTGYASGITYWCIAVISLYVVKKLQPFKDYNILKTFPVISLNALKELLQIGIPIGFAIFCETSIFAVITLLISKYDTVTIAAHQAAMNFASMVYMVPLSISMTLTIVVGYEIGAKHSKDARQYSYMGMGIAILLALFCAAGLLLFNKEVAKLYTSDIAVLEMTGQFLIYAAFFQLSDATAAPIQGILRGYKDVNVTFVVALISYWLIGLLLGYILATYYTYGAVGYWIGIIVGLAFGAVCLLVRLFMVQRKYKIIVD